MCGRIFQIHNVAQLMQYARTGRVRNAANFNPTYNMGPTNYIPAIRNVQENDSNWDQEEQHSQNEQEQQSQNEQNEQEQLSLNLEEQQSSNQQQQQEQQNKKQSKGKRGLDFLKWGYQTKFNLILNARVEEMHEKYTFKPLLNEKRCIVIADGYYEWNDKKEPFKFQSTKPLLLAAMYTDSDEVFVLTRDAFGDFAKVHNRMPVLLEDDEIDLWIDPKVAFYDIIDKKILNQQKKIWSQVECVKVAPFVNNMKEKGEKCLMTLQEYKDSQFKKGIGKFFQKKQVEKPDPPPSQQTEKITKEIS